MSPSTRRRKGDLPSRLDYLEQRVHDLELGLVVGGLVEGGQVLGQAAVPAPSQLTYGSVNLDIPDHWNSYVVRIWMSFETSLNTATGAATMQSRLFWNGGQIAIKDRITLDNNVQDSRRAVSPTGRVVVAAPAATGSITAHHSVTLNAQSNGYVVRNGDFLVEARRTS